jgi:hypothetical protein
MSALAAIAQALEDGLVIDRGDTGKKIAHLCSARSYLSGWPMGRGVGEAEWVEVIAGDGGNDTIILSFIARVRK